MFESVGLSAARISALAGLDVERLSESSLLDTVVECQRLVAWATSVQLRALAALDAATDPDPVEQLPDPDWHSHQRSDRKRSTATELGLVLKIPASYAYDRLSEASVLANRAPRAIELLADGQMSPIQARDLAGALIGLADEACATVLRRVLERAIDDSTGQFRSRLRRAVLAAAPRTAEVEHAAAVADRKVVVRPDEHGTATLWARLPAPEALRIRAAIDERADRYLSADPGDDRTTDQRRADALVELVDCGANLAGMADTADTADPAEGAARPRRLAPVIQVVVSLETLLAVSDEPGELVGHGPIPASLTRRLAADPDSTWRRLVTDPLGQVVDYGRRRYKPPKDLDEFIRARDQRCVFPNCNRPAAGCELDHLQPWDDRGETSADNLATECASHHHLKHDHGWSVVRDPATGLIEWTSPTGHTYRDPSPELPGT
jgi:Domain of unknown function (DUF222)